MNVQSPVRTELREPTANSLVSAVAPEVELVLLARALWRIGYRDSIAGHITFNMGDGTLLCNPWALTWEELRPADVLRIDLDGNVLEGSLLPPRGIPLHLAYHRAHPSTAVVLHNHPEWATVWADMREVPPPMDQTSGQGGGRLALVSEYEGVVRDMSIAERVVELGGDADMMLLAGHGVLVVADDVPTAFHRAYSLEYRCKNAWRVRAAGGVLKPTAPDTVIEAWAQRRRGVDDLWFAAARAELRIDPSLVEQEAR